MVELPVDILVALSQQVHQSGQTQAQVILAALRSALKVEPVPPPFAPTTPQRNPEQIELLPGSHALDSTVSDRTISDPTTSDPTATPLTAPLLAEIEQLKLRLRQLEALIPKVNDLMGKSIAF